MSRGETYYDSDYKVLNLTYSQRSTSLYTKLSDLDYMDNNDRHI